MNMNLRLHNPEDDMNMHHHVNLKIIIIHHNTDRRETFKHV